MKPKNDYELNNILHIAFEQFASQVGNGHVSAFNRLLIDESPVAFQVSIVGEASSLSAKIEVVDSYPLNNITANQTETTEGISQSTPEESLLSTPTLAEPVAETVEPDIVGEVIEEVEAREPIEETKDVEELEELTEQTEEPETETETEIVEPKAKRKTKQ